MVTHERTVHSYTSTKSSFDILISNTVQYKIINDRKWQRTMNMVNWLFRFFVVDCSHYLSFQLDWNQPQNGQYTHGDTSLHSVHGQIHAGPHSIPAHTDSGVDPNLLNNQNNNDTGAFVSAGTAGQQGFDVRTLGLSEQELRETGLHPSFLNTGRQLPLDQYKINYDPNPIIIRKQIPVEMPTYKQQVIVRYRKKRKILSSSMSLLFQLF